MFGLQGLRVLDLSVGIAGPFCTRLLADCGADVIKIEDPSAGDWSRKDDGFYSRHEDAGGSALYAFLNQNKRGISLSLQSASGREIFKRLVQVADVVVESFKPGTLARLGLGYQNLAGAKPDIVLVSITDFGQTGPYLEYRATHLTLAALGGWMHMLGDPAREPLQTGFPVLYYVAGIVGAIGAVAALRGRKQDGRGQQVDVSVMEVALNMIPRPEVQESYGRPPQKRWVPFPMYVKARDRWVAVNALTAQQWQSACLLMGMTDLLEDAELSYSMAKRESLRGELEKRANDWAKDKTREEIFYSGQQLRIPTGLLYTPKEMLECPQFLAREFMEEVSQPGLGKFRQPRAPFRAPSLRRERQVAPRPGEHNAEVYSDLGLEAPDLVSLRVAGVI